MTVISSELDHSALTMTLVAHFEAEVEQVWQLWSDPRQLERWWGLPTHPATFVIHELLPGGDATFFMTGPRGEIHHGWWKVLSVTAPTHLEFIDGFADANGNHVEEHPASTVLVTLDQQPDKTVMRISSTYETRAGFEQMESEGMEDGWVLCIDQMDALLKSRDLASIVL